MRHGRCPRIGADYGERGRVTRCRSAHVGRLNVSIATAAPAQRSALRDGHRQGRLESGRREERHDGVSRVLLSRRRRRFRIRLSVPLHRFRSAGIELQRGLGRFNRLSQDDIGQFQIGRDFKLRRGGRLDDCLMKVVRVRWFGNDCQNAP